MTADRINKIIKLSQEKKILLIEILSLTKKQKDLIEEDNIDDLGIVLIDKENLMNKIDLLDKDFLSLYNSIKSDEGIDSLEKIDIRKFGNLKSLRDIVGEINKILDDISSIDRENKKNMKLNIDKVKLNIKQVKKGKKAYKGYNYETVESMLIDEKK